MVGHQVDVGHFTHSSMKNILMPVRLRALWVELLLFGTATSSNYYVNLSLHKGCIRLNKFLGSEEFTLTSLKGLG